MIFAKNFQPCAFNTLPRGFPVKFCNGDWARITSMMPLPDCQKSDMFICLDIILALDRRTDGETSTTRMKKAPRETQTLRALALVRFGHRPPTRPLQRPPATDRTDYTAPLSLARSVTISRSACIAC